MSNVYEFARLFGLGTPDLQRIEAFGTGKGQWVKRPVELADIIRHLKGEGVGLGIPPLRKDGTVWFAAIDLDEPDFPAARDMQRFIPGDSWIERSRSGNAHVWVFFSAPIEAWVVRGILREAILAAGKGAVEVFPKQDRLLEGMVGSYINLPYFGDTRPVLLDPGDVEEIEQHWHPDLQEAAIKSATEYELEEWVERATDSLNDPDKWRSRARWLMLVPPEQRLRSSDCEFGENPNLHMCAEWMLANRDSNPLVEGHRNAVFFALARQLSNYAGFDHDEAWHMMQLMNESSLDPAPESEMRRILFNAERGRYTSTGCDDPLVQPYCHPACQIGNLRSK